MGILESLINDCNQIIMGSNYKLELNYELATKAL